MLGAARGSADFAIRGLKTAHPLQERPIRSSYSESMTQLQTPPRTRGPAASRNDLVVASTFVQAARDMGYLSVSSAIAELIDNAIQASATHVRISISRNDESGYPKIEVEDDGVGMNEDVLSTCLQFGGSTRFGDRASLGRFGVGLPAASLSQSRRVEVRSWQAIGPVLVVDLDLDTVSAGARPNFTATPDLVGRIPATPAGTRVTWTTCDRIEYKRLTWLERSLRRDLGRIFRKFIGDGLSLMVGTEEVRSIDPLMRDVVVRNTSPSVPLSDLVYEFAHGDQGHTSTVTVAFTELPVDPWSAMDSKEKRALGIVGGAGVSVMRAGREISNGWLFMGDKRRENYDDWWRCEIRFDAELDDLFGITNTKQGIRPSQHLLELLSKDIEPIARLLNSRARQAFEAAKFAAAASSSCRIAEAAEEMLPALERELHVHGPLSYALRSEARSGDAMFAADLDGDVLTVTVDREHAAFAALYAPLQTMDSDEGKRLRGAIELFILSYARAALGSPASSSNLLSGWSTVYSKMVRHL